VGRGAKFTRARKLLSAGKKKKIGVTIDADRSEREAEKRGVPRGEYRLINQKRVGE